MFLLNLTSIEAQVVIREVNTTGIGQAKKTLRSDRKYALRAGFLRKRNE